MDLTIVLAIALIGLGAVSVFLVRGHAERERQLKRDIEAVEIHNRNVENENARLKAEGASLSARLKDREEAHARLAEAHVKLGESHAKLEQSRVALEQACAALEQKLRQLSADKEDLERRTRGFQGEWDRQMTTLEEEIQTVVRQLGEFRTGTKLPLPAGPDPTKR